MRLTCLRIPGPPVAKQRARAANGHHYTPGRTRAYEEKVATYAMTHRPMPAVPLGVEVQLVTKHKLRGDLDNYAKAILDGLVKGRLIADDRLISSLSISKKFSDKEEAVYVEVWEANGS